jgi:hypothetical protein
MSSGSASPVADGSGSLGWLPRTWAVLEVDAVQLERDAVLAGAGDVLARLEPAGEADGLTGDEVLGGGRGRACQTIRSR